MERGCLAVGVEQLTHPEARGVLIQPWQIVGAGEEHGAFDPVDLVDQGRGDHGAAGKSVNIETIGIDPG